MQYSLKTFIESNQIHNYLFSNFVESLNKIGIEVENYFLSNKELYIEIKLPADRSDLKISYYFFQDIINSLKLKKSKKWLYLKKHYEKIFVTSLKNETSTFNKKMISNPKISYNIFPLRKVLLKKVIGINNYNQSDLKSFYFDIVGETKDKIYIKVPSYRKDLKREIDLIEEYCKYLKFENFKVNYPAPESYKKNVNREKINLIRNFFIVNNYTEVFTSTLSPKANEKTNQIISLLNPLNKELESLSFGNIINHQKILSQEIKRKSQKEIKLFEISRVFNKALNQIKEVDFLECSKSIFQGEKNYALLYLETKGEFDKFFEYMGVKDIKAFVSSEVTSLKKTEIMYKMQNTVIAKLSVNKELEKVDYFSFTFQLNLTQFLKLLEYPKTQKINVISKYPEIEKDLSFSSNKSINLNAIKAELITKYPLIKSLNIFDLYLKGKLTKFAMRIKFQSFTGTLTNLEIETEIQKIIAHLHKQYSLNLAI